jgi:hypothetical protein
MRRSARDVSEANVHNVAHAAVADLVVPNGSGQELGKLSGVVARLSPLKNTDPLLRTLFGLLYPEQTYTKETAKASIRKFKGFSAECEWDGSMFLFNLKSMPDLRRICKVFDLREFNTVAKCVERIVLFLANPDEGDETVGDAKSVKRKTKAQSVAKGAAPVQTTAMSGYMHFCAVEKAGVKTAYPKATVCVCYLHFSLVCTGLVYLAPATLLFHLIIIFPYSGSGDFRSSCKHVGGFGH